VRVGEYWAVRLQWPKGPSRIRVTVWFEGFEADDVPIFATLTIRRFRFDSREAAHLYARKLAEREPSVRISVVHVLVNKA
jgi:hypothetical protein